MRCHDETMTTVVRTLRNSIRTVGKLRDKTCQLMDIIPNIKNALRGTYHAIRPKYAQRYLSEFEYRFNRRFDLPDIIPRLVYVALRTPPMPERLLKLRLA